MISRSLGLLLCSAALLAVTAPVAAAIVQAPQTVDGPSTAILEFGGVAMATDGSGGLVYTKEVEGVPHVFASRYLAGRWSAPLRVDADQPYDASQPRVAAEAGGRLMVVWVTQVATVESKIRRGLYSATLGKGAAGFAPPLLIDPNVGDGTGVDPAVVGVSANAIVAYRAVTSDFVTDPGSTTVAQLRPGDVAADVRLARLNGDRWSRLGAINRNLAVSMRPPNALNAPQVGIGAGGNAVVAWQEPDLTGAARIWSRRVFGTTVGPPVQVSPSSWEGQPVSADADALALDVTPFDQARIVARVGGGAGGPLSGQRLFLGTLGPNYAEDASRLKGPVLADGSGGSPPAGPLGTPAVGAADEGGGDGSMRLVFTAGGQLHQVAADDQGNLTELPLPPGPPAQPGAEAVAAVDPEGGGVAAYEALDVFGRPAVAVRQEFPTGAAQTGLISGRLSGPISHLRGSRSGVGDALIGFLQGEPGRFEIVAARVAAPPAKFTVNSPERWVRPPQAKLRWHPAPSAVGGITYGVVLDGRLIKSGLTARRYRPRPALLGSGVRRLQVLATDALGGQLLSRKTTLRVDSEPPTASVKAKGRRALVLLRDPNSGVRAAVCRFGDGSKRVRGRRSCHHTYERPGSYTITVRERDKAGNRIARLLRVKIR